MNTLAAMWRYILRRLGMMILLLFGGKKIPELMHGLGKGVRSFKKGMNEIEEEINTPPAPDNKEKSKEEKK